MKQNDNDVCVFEKIKISAMDCSCGLIVLFFSDEFQEDFPPEVYFSIERGIDTCCLIEGLINTTDNQKKLKREMHFQNYWQLPLNDSTKEKVSQLKEDLKKILMQWGKEKPRKSEIEKLINSIIIFSSKSWQKIIKRILKGGKIEWDDIFDEI